MNAVCAPCASDARVRVAALETPDGPLCVDHARTLLRTYDRRRLMAIAAGGGPRSQADHDVVYCPMCNCNKGGYADEPNARTEACDDYECLCHQEDGR